MGPALILRLLASATAIAASGFAVHVNPKPTVRTNVHISFAAPRLPAGGYYYAVVVLRPYRRYTRSSPPPCATSSDMQRTDYGWPGPHGRVRLALTPAKSATGHWCRSGRYEGAVYAVPHAPPCESEYPCRSEPYEPPSPCWNAEGRVLCGLVARPQLWSYPDRLPAPLARGTAIEGRFSIAFPAR